MQNVALTHIIERKPNISIAFYLLHIAEQAWGKAILIKNSTILTVQPRRITTPTSHTMMKSPG